MTCDHPKINYLEDGKAFCLKCLKFVEKKKPKGKSKFGNKRCEADSFKFDSMLERSYYYKLKKDREDGKIKYFLMQVPLHLPANIKYIADFMTVDYDNKINYIDVKGVETDVFKLKKKLVKEYYGIDIKVVKSGW